MTSPLLSKGDLDLVTGKKTHQAQKAWLIESGIPFRERRDGSVMLTWPVIHYCLIGQGVNDGPDLSALDRLG